MADAAVGSRPRVGRELLDPVDQHVEVSDRTQKLADPGKLIP